MYTVIALILLNITGYDKVNQMMLSDDFSGAYQLLQKLDPSYSYNDYYYYSLVCNYRLNNKELAEKDLVKLNDSFLPFSQRQKAMIYLIGENLKHWSNDGLDDISREMSKSADRLKTLDPNATTQNIQKGIVDKLNKLIDEMENPPKGNPPGNPGDPNGPPKPKNGDGQDSPADDSKIMGSSGKGELTEKKLRELSQSWGGLLPQERAKVTQELTRNVPDRYKQMFDSYLKSLNKMK